MNNENILSVNVANGVSILIMGAGLAIILAALRMYATGKPMKFGNVSQAALVS